MLLKQAHGDGIPVGDDCKKREFRKLEEEVDSIYLTNDELQTLFTLDLGDTPRLAKVRDLFLIGCYTGLRFSDFTQLRPANIVLGGRILTVATQKTGARVSIPLNPNVLAILAKYTRTNNADTTGPGTLPRALTNQKFNQYLKELAERAGAVNPAFCSLIERTRTEGGRKETRTVQKWELVTTHTARRSFATNAFLAGLPPESIMKVTGHKSAVMFMKYIKVTTEQNALLLLNHPHFGGSGMPDLLNTIVRPLHQRASD